MSDWQVIAAKLGAATLVGALIGLNRDLHKKPTGVRTLGLVGLATALAVVAADEVGFDHGDLSRVGQGIVTGIGFLGAGVIVHDDPKKIHGLTTAATVWLVACLGIACGLGAWRPMLLAVGLVLLVLIFGGRLERAFRHSFDPPEDSDAGNGSTTPGDGARTEPDR
jgi:putative Mg2+ transporter-C (MgtC) family protein